MALRALDALEQLEAAAIRKLQVEHHAVEVPLLELCEGLLARAHSDRVDVAATDELDERLALLVGVLDDEEPPSGVARGSS